MQNIFTVNVKSLMLWKLDFIFAKCSPVLAINILYTLESQTPQIFCHRIFPCNILCVCFMGFACSDSANDSSWCLVDALYVQVLCTGSHDGAQIPERGCYIRHTAVSQRLLSVVVMSHVFPKNMDFCLFSF
ncbi:hypothetical protein AMECASPLE_011082 [Ameca splendens]|uniref:Uncharacterized protein n=1 Tax=Ameca splendens TaxID=208324 RepID=A0ABV1A706_9TELE